MGVHTICRTSIEANYIAVGSTLKLPTEYGCRVNDSNYCNGAFGEFFHGLYTNSGSHGFDAGVYGDAGGFRLFINCLPATNSQQWFQGVSLLNSTTAGKGKTILLKTFLQKSGVDCYITAQACKTDGTAIDALSVWISSSAYNALMAGSRAYREMTMAINPTTKGGKSVSLPANAYFKGAEFSAGTMTRTTGSYVAMNASTSNTNLSGSYQLLTASQKSSYYDGVPEHNVSGSGSTFSIDRASATLNKPNYPVR